MRWVAVLFALLMAIQTADARVVAILFDDSGSMAGRRQLPAFAAQLLVSTLDGRPGEDRAIAGRMSQLIELGRPFEEIAIGTTAAQQASIDAIARDWPADSKLGTPFEQMGILLEEIANIRRPDEEAFLIVITDGEFQGSGQSDTPPSEAEARSLFAARKQALKGRLRAEFILIGANDPDSSGTEPVKALVERQGIRKALLETFNDDARKGSYDIDDSATLVEVVKDVVARVASTDRTGQRRFVNVSGNSVAIDTPLSVKRIVAVATGSEALPPAQALNPTFKVDGRSELSSRMLGTDRRGGWQNEKLAGLATHFIFDPALPAGRHEVPFDRKPDGVFLLFQTAAGLRLSLRDSAGQAFPTENGRVKIPLGSKAKAVLDIVDSVNGQTVSVPLAALGDAAALTAHNEFASKTAQLDVVPDPSGTGAAAELDTPAAGAGSVRASLQISGFVSTFVQPVAYDIIDVAGSLGIRIEGVEACPVCAADEVRYTVSASGGRKAIARVIVETEVPVDGQLSLALDGAPPWVSLAEASGASPFTPVAVPRGAPTRIEAAVLADPGANLADILKSESPAFSIVARLEGGPAGTASAQARIRIVPAEARLEVTATSLDPTGKTVLDLSLEALTSGNESINLLLVEALTSAEAGTLTADLGTTFTGIDLEAQGNRIVARPRLAWWCACLAFLDRGEHKVLITWIGPDGLQKSSAETRIIVNPSAAEIGWACALLALNVLGALYLLRALWVFFKANRFPRRSGVSVNYGKREEPVYRQLRRWDWTPLKALLWPIFGTPHEVRAVEGLTLRAARGGGLVLVTRSDSSIRIAVQARTLKELREENPKLETVRMNWNDMAERRDAGRRQMTLLRRPEDRPGRA